MNYAKCIRSDLPCDSFITSVLSMIPSDLFASMTCFIDTVCDYYGSGLLLHSFLDYNTHVLFGISFDQVTRNFKQKLFEFN